MGSEAKLQMATNRSGRERAGRRSPWIAVSKFLFIALFTVMLFLLARSMVRNHFFDGGQLNRPDAAQP
jgi:hypothetical protein